MDTIALDSYEGTLPVTGRVLKLHSTYPADAIARMFWRASYRPTRNYCTSTDALGGPIIWMHSREEPDGYARRKKTTKCPNFVGPIVRQYNNFVFRKPADRAREDLPPLYEMFADDCTGDGVPLGSFLARGLLLAQVNREVYYMPLSSAPEGVSTVNRAQLEQGKIRPYVRRVRADDVVDWRDESGQLTEAVALMLVNGRPVARYMNADFTQDFALTEELQREGSVAVNYRVGTAEPAVPHKYGGLPLVRHRPQFDDLDTEEAGDSQVGPIAELQQAFANYLSLYNEELFNCVFSQVMISGASKADVGEVKFGSNRVLLFPSADASMQMIGADAAQAATIMTAMAWTATNLYRAAGIDSPDPTATKGAAESGLAKSFKFQNLAAALAALAESCQDAENRLVQLIANAWGFEAPKPAVYPDNFDMPDYDAEMTTLVSALALSALPKTIKAAAAERFAARNLNLDSEQQAELSEEMAGDDDGDGPESAFPPPRAPAPPPPEKPAPIDHA